MERSSSGTRALKSIECLRRGAIHERVSLPPVAAHGQYSHCVACFVGASKPFAKVPAPAQTQPQAQASRHPIGSSVSSRRGLGNRLRLRRACGLARSSKSRSIGSRGRRFVLIVSFSLVTRKVLSLLFIIYITVTIYYISYHTYMIYV